MTLTGTFFEYFSYIQIQGFTIIIFAIISLLFWLLLYLLLYVAQMAGLKLNVLEMLRKNGSEPFSSCQTEIAKKIKKKEADYLLCLKENQKTLYDNVLSIF